jgi:hypothetical protein
LIEQETREGHDEDGHGLDWHLHMEREEEPSEDPLPSGRSLQLLADPRGEA